MNSRDYENVLAALEHPLTESDELEIGADLVPELAAQCYARLARRRAGFERKIEGPMLHCTTCERDVPTRAVNIDGIAHWLCQRVYHVLDAITDLSMYGVRVHQLPTWKSRKEKAAPINTKLISDDQPRMLGISQLVQKRHELQRLGSIIQTPISTDKESTEE